MESEVVAKVMIDHCYVIPSGCQCVVSPLLRYPGDVKVLLGHRYDVQGGR